VRAFHEGLAETGFSEPDEIFGQCLQSIEGRNVTIDTDEGRSPSNDWR